MQALVYSLNPPGWVACKLLKRIWRGCLYTSLNGVAVRNIAAPKLPGDNWVLIRTLLGGICGSDLAVFAQKTPPDSILQAFCSLPAVFGHENVSVVEQVGPAVDKSWIGKRVCVEPTLCCEVRGIDPPCPRCKVGEFSACESFADLATGAAALPPGTSTGYNRATGGSFGEFFVAHASQLIEPPEDISDELAVLTDPIACSLHAVLRAGLTGANRVLVYGAGMIGLGIIASLRWTGYKGIIDALDLHEYLEKPARALGADNFLRLPSDKRQRFEKIAEITGATLQRVRFNNYMLSGGYDAVFECSGSVRSLEESLKWTAARGQVIMVATGSGRGADLTPIWFRELSVIGAYGRQIENFAGRRIGTYKIVHEIMQQGKLDLRPLLTHTFRLEDYAAALDTAMFKAGHRAIKVALDFRFS